MSKKKKSFAQRVEALHARYELGLEALAEKARQEVVIPFCNKYGVWFVSGMGIYSFEKIIGDPENPYGITSLDWDRYLEDGFTTTGDPEDKKWIEDRKPPDGYGAVRDVVNIEVPSSQAWGGVSGTLGLYMSDYIPFPNCGSKSS